MSPENSVLTERIAEEVRPRSGRNKVAHGVSRGSALDPRAHALGYDLSPLTGLRKRRPHEEDSIRGLLAQDTGRYRTNGFTLLELMMVLTLILILASIAFPTYHVATIRAREAVLKDDLYTMRSLIDEFTIDKQRPPTSLDELVDAGYLRGGIPVDPFTKSKDTWKADYEDVPSTQTQAGPGIIDVHSGSDAMSLDETPYSSW